MYRLSSLLILLFLLPLPVHGQFTDLGGDVELRWFTDADRVKKGGDPPYYGPYNWAVIPKSYTGSCEPGMRGDEAGIECTPSLPQNDWDAMEDFSNWEDCSWEDDGMCGEIYFYRTWQEYPVSKFLCDKVEDDTSRTQEVRAVDTYDGPIEACTDNINAYEPNRTSGPYESFGEMRAAQKRCWNDFYDRYDSGHSPPWPWRATWAERVPKGWGRGADATADSTKFMDWCTQGGPMPFDKKPFPGGDDEMENDLVEIWEEAESRAGTITYDNSKARDKYGDPVAWWETDDGKFAIEKCNRIYKELLNERERAFTQLCETEPYSHWDGCKEAREFCTGDSDDEKVTGVGTCCTEKYPEYHYFKERRFEIPCKPFDAFRWYDPGRLDKGKWMDDQYDKTSSKNPGWNSAVYRDDNRGFVGSGGVLNAISAGGKPMEVRSKGPKIGSYFFFDIQSGTVGLKSFKNARQSQSEVKLPGSYADDDEAKYYVGTYDCNWLGLNCGGDLISDQRDGVEGWVKNLYFCEETFTREQLDAINREWGTLPDELIAINDELGITCQDYEERYNYNTQYMENCSDTVPTGRIKGRVYLEWPDGVVNAIDGATVTVDANGEQIDRTTTEAGGRYETRPLAVESHSITANIGALPYRYEFPQHLYGASPKTVTVTPVDGTVQTVDITISVFQTRRDPCFERDPGGRDDEPEEGTPVRCPEDENTGFAASSGPITNSSPTGGTAGTMGNAFSKSGAPSVPTQSVSVPSPNQGPSGSETNLGSLGFNPENEDLSSVPHDHVWWVSMSLREVEPDGALGSCGIYDSWEGPYRSYNSAMNECDRLEGSSVLCGCVTDHTPATHPPGDAEISNPGLLP